MKEMQVFGRIVGVGNKPGKDPKIIQFSIEAMRQPGLMDFLSTKAAVMIVVRVASTEEVEAERDANPGQTSLFGESAEGKKAKAAKVARDRGEAKPKAKRVRPSRAKPKEA